MSATKEEQTNPDIGWLLKNTPHNKDDCHNRQQFFLTNLYARSILVAEDLSLLASLVVVFLFDSSFPPVTISPIFNVGIRGKSPMQFVYSLQCF